MDKISTLIKGSLQKQRKQDLYRNFVRVAPKELITQSAAAEKKRMIGYDTDSKIEAETFVMCTKEDKSSMTQNNDFAHGTHRADPKADNDKKWDLQFERRNDFAVRKEDLYQKYLELPRKN